MCKKRLVLSVFAGMVLLVCSGLPAAIYSGGSGTDTAPYLISSSQDWLDLVATPADWSMDFALISDIDLDGVVLSPIGNTSTKFSGSFDGCGHVVSNAVIDLPSTNYVGIFGYVTGGAISDLRIANATVIGRHWVGGVVGRFSYSQIKGVTFDGSVSGIAYVGGAIGYVGELPGAVERCSAIATVNGNRYVGGLVGNLWGANVENSFAQSIIYSVVDPAGGSSESIGGFVGYTYETPGYANTITNCYSASVLYPDVAIDAGCFLGKDSGVTSSGCVCDIQLCSLPIIAAVGKTTLNMKDATTYIADGWDLTGVWGIGQYQTYPYLHVSPSADLNYDGVVNLADFSIMAQQWLAD